MTAAGTAARAESSLDAAVAHTVSEVSRTDTKAGLLLTLDGVLVAVLSLLGTHVRGWSLGFAIVGAVALVGSVVLSLLVIRPRMGGNGVEDKGSFAWIATASEAELEEALAVDWRRARLQALSRLTLRKMRFLSLSADAALAAVVALATAILVR